ncbi:unnamed protein product [Pleuronectes platessa]|uniref:Uncharacterized protein n=1 Tax=Pleuronectes platessa TaxID=8262 RepID=A0A9N7YB76_PLEPL|nr:unnamed protein product [Pleuronectes platessa]
MSHLLLPGVPHTPSRPASPLLISSFRHKPSSAVCKASLGWMFGKPEINFDLQPDQSELSAVRPDSLKDKQALQQDEVLHPGARGNVVIVGAQRNMERRLSTKQLFTQSGKTPVMGSESTGKVSAGRQRVRGHPVDQVGRVIAVTLPSTSADLKQQLLSECNGCTLPAEPRGGCQLDHLAPTVQTSGKTLCCCGNTGLHCPM